VPKVLEYILNNIDIFSFLLTIVIVVIAALSLRYTIKNFKLTLKNP